ncbi:hypothetical protein ACP4OV_031112 [Aristida adscensionis]
MSHTQQILVLLFTLHIPASSAMADTISAGQALPIGGMLISKNGRYALGFFEEGSESSENNSSWYLGIWFYRVPKVTQIWVANRDDPIMNPTSLVLKISHDGNLVISNNNSNNSIFWSSQANVTRNSTIAILHDSGNLILRNDSNSSDILWQSFDHPTDTFFPGAKLGWDKVTGGVNRRLVSRKNSVSPATGAYCYEMDPSGVNQLILKPLNSSTPYWSSGEWNGQTFAAIPEMASHTIVNSTFVDNDQEKYFTYGLVNETVVMHHVLDISGQVKTFIWFEASQDWTMVYAKPRAPCEVYAICGPFTICNDYMPPHCTCMKGFTIQSPEDWVIDDRTGGCLRNTPLDCTANGSTTNSTDKFYSMTCVSFLESGITIEFAKSVGECTQACLNNCSCTAYSFSDGRCSNWHDELLSISQVECGDATDDPGGQTLYLRLAAKDLRSLEENKRWFVLGVTISACVAALGLFAITMFIMFWRNKWETWGTISNSVQGCNGITAFRYIELQHATNKFSEKIGGGGFGSVFKGLLKDSTSIAVKRLDHAGQGEKQFRTEVSTIGIIQHINLVRLVGFCCENAMRLLVYEHMPNGSLDRYLFQDHVAILKWSTRYQIALGVAKGLAYLHNNCRDCIIHCDIKPENILLDDMFVPKIADFGMAKFLGRDFSQVLTTMRGTIGYLAPEWISGVAITPKVDVYAYGMVLFEIISGRRNSCVSCSCGRNHDIYYPVHVAQKILKGDVTGLVDDRLNGDINLKEVEMVCKLACWCIQDEETNRPTMVEVVQILEGLHYINLPPMPGLLQQIDASSNSTCSSSTFSQMF